MKNDLYNAIVPYIAEHGFKHTQPNGMCNDSSIDRLHAVISHLSRPERYFIYLLNKSFLIGKWNEPDETRESRRSLSSVYTDSHRKS